MFLIVPTASNVRKAKAAAASAALCVLAACSSEKVIAHNSNEIVAAAQSSRGRFVWIADEAGKPAPNLPGIQASALEGVTEQSGIIKSAATIIYNLPGVRDVTPVWAEMLVWALIAISIVGCVLVVFQTGIPKLIAGWIGRLMPKKADA